MLDILFDKNRFYGGDDPNNPLAEISFERRGDRLVVDHTYTDPSLRGQGIARALVDKVAGYARKEGLKVSAICPYAKKVLAGDEFKDIFIQ